MAFTASEDLLRSVVILGIGVGSRDWVGTSESESLVGIGIPCDATLDACAVAACERAGSYSSIGVAGGPRPHHQLAGRSRENAQRAAAKDC